MAIPISELRERELPGAFINVFRCKGKVECQTLELVKLNQRISDAHHEVVMMSDRSIQDLIDDVRTDVQPLFKISESIAMLDMIASFAQLVTSQDYVRPELTDTFAVKAGRHPIRERIQREKYIANDVYATQQNRLQIITGCNMSGKSTYIRSVALMTVVAQIGCFVPAQYASFPITHKLFARISTDDSIEANVSTFATEMREVAFILRNIERRSLVIVDELGRGTSTGDGLAVAIAIAEALLKSRAYVWFVTHFRDLPRILKERSGVVNLHLAVQIAPDNSKMKMLYKISDGYEQERFYGIMLARVAGLPEDVIQVAAELSDGLHERNEARRSNKAFLPIARRRKLILSSREQLIQAKYGLLEGPALRHWLRRLQNELIVRMTAIDAEAGRATNEAEDAGSNEGAGSVEAPESIPSE
jgi:DNA mismatch repair protein MSH4